MGVSIARKERRWNHATIRYHDRFVPITIIDTSDLSGYEDNVAIHFGGIHFNTAGIDTGHDFGHPRDSN